MPTCHSTSRWCCLLLVVAAAPLAAFDEPPRVSVQNARRVFHNGEHNAFTDLVRFRDRYYLTFRSCPDGHAVHHTASIIILASDDLLAWQPVHRFRVERRDTRDPHFLVFRDRLFVYTGTWYAGEAAIPPDEYDLNLHLGYAVWTEDGTDWQGPTQLEGTFGHYVWRAAAHGETAYLCGRRKQSYGVRLRGERPEVESALLASDDGLVWRFHSLFQEVQGNETAFAFEPDGRLLAIGRRTGNAQILRAGAPYTVWDRRDLDRYIGGPLLARWGDRWVVGGRKMTAGRNPRTSLCWLLDDELYEFAELPSGGDNSYPGLVELSPTRAVVSWYSSHETDADGRAITAIYLADLVIP